jgi:ABC-type glutathione transport system ATPase component
VRLLADLRDRGTTVFVVTHQASLLEAAADEFVWMEFGKIVGRTRELKLLADGAAPRHHTRAEGGAP